MVMVLLCHGVSHFYVTGFLFNDATSEALSLALKDALDIYGQKDAWLRIQENGMKADFSWDKSALQYVNLYERLVKSL